MIDEGQFPCCPRLMVAGLVSATGAHVRGRLADGPWEVRRAVREMATARAHLCIRGIPVGTDGGPGAVMYEVEELVNCGISSGDAMVAPTCHSAEALDIADRVGTIKPGKRADMLVVDIDPLNNVSSLHCQENISRVFKDGRQVVGPEAPRA